MDKRICSIDDCTKPGTAGRGWCPMHYSRWRTSGNPTLTSGVAHGQSNEERLLRRSHKVESGCWEWTGNRSPLGYGRVIAVGRVSYRANRLAYETWNGPIPSGMLVCHTCDNPPCINPAHLFLGSPLDNMLDKQIKGRQPHGEAIVTAVLTRAEVLDIRHRFFVLGMNQTEIAKHVPCTQSNISLIVRGIRWREVAEEDGLGFA